MKVTKIKPAFVSGGGGEPEPPPPVEERMEVPAGGIIMYANADTPEGFGKVEGLTFVMVSGSTTVNKTPTGGSLSSHTHTVPDSNEAGAHTHDMAAGGVSGGASAGFAGGYYDAVSPPGHSHSVSVYGASTNGAHQHSLGGLVAGSVQVPFVVLNYIKNVSGNLAVAPVGSIVMFDGALATIPDGWAICDGSNSTVDMRERFAYGTTDNADLLVSGGAKTHTHTKPTVSPNGAHIHNYKVSTGSATGSGQNAWEQSAGPTNVVWPGHKHPVRNATTIEQAAHTHDVSQPSEESHMPLYLYLYYIQRIT